MNSFFDSFIDLTVQTFPASVVKTSQPKHTNEPNSKTTPTEGFSPPLIFFFFFFY